jgi:hypothetical protein
MTCQHRARARLEEFAKRYPDAFAAIDRFRGMKNSDPDFQWPDWCYVPMSGAHAVIEHHHQGDVLSNISAVAELSAYSAWRLGQYVLRFDPALYERLIETELGNIPCTTLLRLPAYCIYIETPGLVVMGEQLHGFFAFLEFDYRSGPELRLLLDYGDRVVSQPIIFGSESGTLADAIVRLTESARMRASSLSPASREGIATYASQANAMAGEITPLVSLLLYACSSEFDADRPLQTPQPVKTKRGTKYFAAPSPTVVQVGARLGAALREAYRLAQTQAATKDGSSDGNSVTPHLRKAHWHTYRLGPKKDTTGKPLEFSQRPSELRWLPPIPVNIHLSTLGPTTIRPVR